MTVKIVNCGWMHLSASLRRLSVLSYPLQILPRQHRRYRHHVALICGTHPSQQLQVGPNAVHADSYLYYVYRDEIYSLYVVW